MHAVSWRLRLAAPHGRAKQFQTFAARLLPEFVALRSSSRGIARHFDVLGGRAGEDMHVDRLVG
jgi:hypothetical protein